MTTVKPESALESPVDGSIAGSKGKPLFLKRYEHPNAQYTLVLVHGTAGYSAAYHDFAEQFRRHFPATVWAFDLTGHGRTPGPRGVFTFEDFLEDVRAVSDHAAERTGLPVVLHGASQGGEIAFHALARCPRVAGAVCMNILLNDELQMNRAIQLMRSPMMDRLARGIGDRVRVPLRRVIDFKAAYQEDPDLLPEKLIDPLNVWSYGFRSYHSVFNYKPREPSAANTKPVLVSSGESDEVVDPDHVRACFERIGGPKDLFVMPGGGHQLMLFETDLYSRVVDSWIRERVLGRARSWTAPLDVEERTYFDFLDRERRSEASGEPDYHYSWLDKLLTRVHNGTIERGVRYFAQAQASAHWRFTEQLVSKIDYAAWPFLRDYLPESARTEPARMAVVGCGSGESIRGLSRGGARASGLGDRWLRRRLQGHPGSEAVLRRRRKRSIPCRGHPRSKRAAQRSIRRRLHARNTRPLWRAPRGTGECLSCAQTRRAGVLCGTGPQPVHLAGLRHRRPVVCVRPVQVDSRLSPVRKTRRTFQTPRRSRLPAIAPSLGRPGCRPSPGLNTRPN